MTSGELKQNDHLRRLRLISNGWKCSSIKEEEKIINECLDIEIERVKANEHNN